MGVDFKFDEQELDIQQVTNCGHIIFLSESLAKLSAQKPNLETSSASAPTMPTIAILRIEYLLERHRFQVIGYSCVSEYTLDLTSVTLLRHTDQTHLAVGFAVRGRELNMTSEMLHPIRPVLAVSHLCQKFIPGYTLYS